MFLKNKYFIGNFLINIFFLTSLNAYAITNNATLAKNYEATADERLREARFIDATENSLGTVESSEFTDARL